jgi:uncharacterized protein (DUF1778 family)
MVAFGQVSKGDKMTPHVHTKWAQTTRSNTVPMPLTAEKRLTARIAGHVQEKLQVAADLVGATLNQFVVQAALEKAEKIIESESTIVLTRRESLRLLDLIENPPARNERFLQAQARYQRIKRDVDSSTE